MSEKQSDKNFKGSILRGTRLERPQTSYDEPIYSYIEELLKWNEDIREARRAALNALEDAILSKEALRRSEEKYRKELETKVRDRTAELNEQKSFTEHIVQTTPDGIMILNIEDEKNIFTNFQFGKLFGYTMDEIKAMGINVLSSLIHPFDQPAQQQAITQLIRSNNYRILEDTFRVLDKEKHTHWVNFRQSVFKRDKAGRPTQVILMLTDITERKKDEEEITRQAHFIRSVTDNVPGIITITKHPSGEIEFSNRDAFEMLGFNAGEMARMGIDEQRKLIHPDDLQRFLAYYLHFDYLNDNEENRVEYRIKNSQGDWIWLDVRGRVFRRDEDGKVIRTLHIGQDITSNKYAEKQILQLKDEIAEKVSDKYYSIFNSIDEGFCIFEMIFDNEKAVDLKWVEVNPAYERQTGLKNTVGKLASDVMPGTENYWLDIYGTVAKTGEAAQFENWHEPTRRWYRVFASRIGGAESRQVAVVFEDITERKHVEQNQSFLSEIMKDLVELQNITDALQSLGEKIAKHFRVPWCVFSEPAHDAETVIAYGWNADGVPSLSGTYKIREFWNAEQSARIDAGEIIIVNDTQGDPLLNLEGPAAVSARSYISIPISIRGKFRFLLTILQPDPRQWRDDEIALLQELVARIWPRLEKARAEEVLRDTLKDTQLLRDLGDRLIAQQDKESIYKEVLDAAIGLTNADAGTLQVYDKATKTLELLATKGFEKDLTDHFHYVDATSNTSCGIALSKNERTFINFDVPASEDPDGSLRMHVEAGYLSAQSTPLISLSGQPIGMISTHWHQHHRPSEHQVHFLDLLARQAADLIEQKLTEEKLKVLNISLGEEVAERTADLIQQHALLKQAEEIAQAGSWDYDVKTKEFLWSDGMYRLFEMKKGDPISPSIYLEYSLNDDLPVARKIVDNIEKNFEPFDELMRIKFNGSYKTLQIKAAPLKNENGEIEKMLGVDIDISRARQSEERIIELNKTLFSANKELDSANSELKTFTSIAANNYSETLRHLYINLEMIVTNDARNLSNSGRANLRRAQGAIQKMKLTTDDLVSYSRLHEIGSKEKDVDLNLILQKVIDDFRSQPGHQLAEINCDNLPPIDGYRSLLSLLFHHLMDNAIKFRKEDNGHVINVTCKEEVAQQGEEKNVKYNVISVEDNGIGFPQTESEEIFKMFYRLHDKTRYKGSGTGLALCKRIMEMHGGYITADGTLDAGASFHCYFPAAGGG